MLGSRVGCVCGVEYARKGSVAKLSGPRAVGELSMRLSVNHVVEKAERRDLHEYVDCA